MPKNLEDMYQELIGIEFNFEMRAFVRHVWSEALRHGASSLTKKANLKFVDGCLVLAEPDEWNMVYNEAVDDCCAALLMEAEKSS